MRACLNGWRLPAFFGSIFVALFLLWLPQARYYPPWNDTATYALLGDSVWERGEYALLGVPQSRQLPLHAILSHPLTRLLGYQRGMTMSTLLAGFGVLASSFFLLRRAFSERVALLAVALLLFHHGFLLMTVQGSADLLFAALFLLSVFGYLRAEEDERWYLLAGTAAGLACLTRYNGVPLFPFFLLWTAWKRLPHLRSQWFWRGILLGGGIFSLWLLRNTFTFGDPFATDYREQLATNSPGILRQLLRNILYYGNPLHNILPVLFLFSLYGMWALRRSHLFLFLAMCAAWAVTAIWFVQGIRFAFPGYPILLGFAVSGLLDLHRRSARFAPAFAVMAALLLIPTHAAALCLYSYGRCNAWFDRTIVLRQGYGRQVGIVPRNLGLSPEGLYAWDQARRFLNARADHGGGVLIDAPWHVVVWRELFREDLELILSSGARSGTPPQRCSLYEITQKPRPGARVLFWTDDAPETSVVEYACE